MGCPDDQLTDEQKAQAWSTSVSVALLLCSGVALKAAMEGTLSGYNLTLETFCEKRDYFKYKSTLIDKHWLKGWQAGCGLKSKTRLDSC